MLFERITVWCACMRVCDASSPSGVSSTQLLPLPVLGEGKSLPASVYITVSHTGGQWGGTEKHPMSPNMYTTTSSIVRSKVTHSSGSVSCSWTLKAVG